MRRGRASTTASSSPRISSSRSTLIDGSVRWSRRSGTGNTCSQRRMAMIDCAAPRKKHQSMEEVHAEDRAWETLRWPGQWSKMLFHPRPDAPTEPNAGLVRYEPGSHHPFHKHDFAQVWYILEGTFRIGETAYGPGTMLYYPDPHF